MAQSGLIFILLGFAAWRDIATRTIPDLVSVGILLAGLAGRLAEGWPAVGMSIAASVVMFVLLLPFHARGVIGGGDVKLLAALACGLSPLGSYQMVSATVLAGGVLAFVYIALRSVAAHCRTITKSARGDRSALHRIVAVELWRIRRGAPLPYGLAIAAGASLVIGHQGA